MSDIRPATFRLDSSTTEKFKELASNLGVTQDKMLQDLISTFELENAKSTLTDRGKEIEEFQSNAQRLINIYLNALELNQNSEARIQERFSEQLIKKQELLSNLQEQVTKYREELKSKDTMLLNTEKGSKKLSEELKQIKDTLFTKEALIDEYKNKIDTLTTLLSEYKEYKNSNDLIKNELSLVVKEKEDYSNQLLHIKLSNENLQGKINMLYESISEYKNTINEIKTEYKQEIINLKNVNKSLNDEKNTQIESLNAKYNNIIDDIKLTNKAELKKETDTFNSNILSLKDENTKNLLLIENSLAEKLEMEKVKFNMEKESLILQYQKLIFEKDKEIENLKGNSKL